MMTVTQPNHHIHHLKMVSNGKLSLFSDYSTCGVVERNFSQQCLNLFISTGIYHSQLCSNQL